MTIRAKLTLNAVIVLVIIVAVAAASLIGMGFVKSKLSDLTERSTPFQMRTVEFQRAIQGVTVDLVKVGTSDTMEEYAGHQAEVSRSLNEVRGAQEALESLSGGQRIETYRDLQKIAGEILQIIRDRIQTDLEAKAANEAISQKLKAASGQLSELDSQVQSLQLSRSAAFTTSLQDVGRISTTLRGIETVRSLLKDLQIAVFEMQRAQDKKSSIIARGRKNAILAKINQEDYLKTNNKIGDEIKILGERMAELIRLRLEADSDPKALESVAKDVDERLSVILITLEQDVIAAREKAVSETEKQGIIFADSDSATSVFASNSRLLAIGLTIEGLTTKLFTLTRLNEIETTENQLKKLYEQSDNVINRLRRGINKLQDTKALKMLQDAEALLKSIKSMLFAEDGVINKVRKHVTMEEKAQRASEALREIVLKQSEKSNQSVSSAKGEQEQAIGTVNKMVRFSSLLIAIISVGSVAFGILFGIWVYRAISRPLAQLMKVADEVSNGNLTYAIPKSSPDEIGSVMTAMAKMVGNLKEIVGKITASTARLASSSEELSATATIIDRGSQEQTSQVEQSATAITEMSQTTLDVAKNASSTAENAQTMKRLAEHGKKAMGVTVSELVKFSDTFSQAADKIDALSRQSQEISNVVSLIKEIAEQTNLLALNAAIEAAHAGEQGRGFAVVADNVRQLAERTALATEDIGRTIQRMQSDVDGTVTLVNHEKEAVGSVLNQVKTTMNEIDQITGNVEQVTDMIQRIAVATDEQSSTSDMVSQSMESIANNTRQLNNSIEEIKRSSVDLSRLATELNAMAGWFKT